MSITTSQLESLPWSNNVLNTSWNHSATQEIANLFTINDLSKKYELWRTSRPIKIKLQEYSIEWFIEDMFKTIYFTQRSGMAISFDKKRAAYVCYWIRDKDRSNAETDFFQYQEYIKNMKSGESFNLHGIDEGRIKKTWIITKTTKWIQVTDTSNDIISIRLSWAWTSWSLKEEVDYWWRWGNSIGPWGYNVPDKSLENMIIANITWNDNSNQKKDDWLTILPLKEIL